MNPCKTGNNRKLYNIITGKDVPDDGKEDLINYKGKGEGWSEEFSSEYMDSPSRFEKSIKRLKFKNYASSAQKSGICGKNHKVELKGTRDLFGRFYTLVQRT